MMESSMNFSDILASTLHDTKNSLGVLFNSLEDIITRCKDKNCAEHVEFYTLQYEIKRLNHRLIRLLSLYKAEKSQIPINIDYHSIRDVLEEAVVQHETLLKSRGIKLTTRCDPALFGAFDRNLIVGVLDNIINNSFRYAKENVAISAFKEDGYLVMRVEDDGTGYPATMLFNKDKIPAFKQEIDFEKGNTGLGLYFSIMVAAMHNNKEKSGFISICNDEKSGGGVFSIYLP
jgi:K+-sensing histidine kinase KdpD